MNDDKLDQKLLQKHSNERNGWSQPEEYDLSDTTDRRILARKLDSNAVGVVTDRIDLVANDLFNVTHPDLKEDSGARAIFVADVLGQGAEYGRWFLYPWSQELVHFPLRDEYRKLHTARNKNLITAEEQKILYAATLAIFGLSVGSSIVDELVISGIGDRMVLADPDIIEPTNSNRINCGFADVGSRKVDLAARKISEADPYIQQVHIEERVGREDLVEIAASYGPDIFIDEVDDLSAKAAIRSQGAKSEIPVIMATDLGDKSILDVERHDLKKTKPFNGRVKPGSVETLVESNDPELAKRMLPKIIGLLNVTPRVLDSFMEQGKTLAGIPQLGMTAAMGGAITAFAIREILLGRQLNSGRYIFSPKDTLKLRSPTSFPVGIKTVFNFIASNKR